MNLCLTSWRKTGLFIICLILFLTFSPYKQKQEGSRSRKEAGRKADDCLLYKQNKREIAYNMNNIIPLFFSHKQDLTV